MRPPGLGADRWRGGQNLVPEMGWGGRGSDWDWECSLLVALGWKLSYVSSRPNLTPEGARGPQTSFQIRGTQGPGRSFGGRSFNSVLAPLGHPIVQMLWHPKPVARHRALKQCSVTAPQPTPGASPSHRVWFAVWVHSVPSLRGRVCGSWCCAAEPRPCLSSPATKTSLDIRRGESKQWLLLYSWP